ncbi:MAG TPA: EAL domain-containing protein [Candidatus Obscuribacterales bacterium]
MPNLISLRWLRRYHRLVIWILGTSLIPPIALLVVTYYQAIATTRTQLEANAERSAQQFSNLLRAADITLRELEVYLNNSNAESQADIWKLLQRIAYNDPRFREVGLVDENGFLVATSVGPVVPPVAIAATPRADLTRKELQVVGPITTAVMQERSIVLALPTQGQGEINILVDPVLLNSFWINSNELELGNEGFLAYIDNRSQRLIASVGLTPRNISTLAEPPPRDRLRVSYALPDADITIVGEVSRSWALRHWKRLLLAMSPIVLLTSLLVLVALVRLLYATHLLDYDLRIGLKNQEFELYYQPIFDMSSNLCVGAEALIRWNHSHQGLILPSIFIPVAEKTGIIAEIGEWTSHQAIKDCQQLLADYPKLYVSINLSPVQINSPIHSQAILNILKQNPAIAPQLMFEITETQIIENSQHSTRRFIANLQAIGAKVALDDFGTGYCGINYLSQLSFDYLKIDRSFIAASDTRSNLATVLDGVIDLGRRLQVGLIAEGVETTNQREALLQRNVCYGQGWLMARAMPGVEFKQFLMSNRATSAPNAASPAPLNSEGA